MLKSEMRKIYNETYGENRKDKVFIEKLNRICDFINNEQFYNSLDCKEKIFFTCKVKPAIDKHKQLPYETMVFFLPLIYTDNYKIINSAHLNDDLSIENMAEWIDELEKAQIALLKRFRKDAERYIKDSSKRKIMNNSKFYDSTKTLKIKQLNEDFEVKFKKISLVKLDIYFTSFNIYIKIREFSIKTIINDNQIHKRIHKIIEYLKYLPDKLKLKLLPQIENLINNEFCEYEEFCKSKNIEDKIKDKYWDGLEIENLRFDIENDEEMHKLENEYEAKGYPILMANMLAVEELKRRKIKD